MYGWIQIWWIYQSIINIHPDPFTQSNPSSSISIHIWLIHHQYPSGTDQSIINIHSALINPSSSISIQIWLIHHHQYPQIWSIHPQYPSRFDQSINPSSIFIQIWSIYHQYVSKYDQSSSIFIWIWSIHHLQNPSRSDRSINPSSSISIQDWLIYQSIIIIIPPDLINPSSIFI